MSSQMSSDTRGALKIKIRG